MSIFISLPDDKIVALTKLKAFADDKFSVAEMMISFRDRLENIEEKGENADYQHFLLFPQCFQKVSSPSRENPGLFGKGLIEKLITTSGKTFFFSMFLQDIVFKY